MVCDPPLGLPDHGIRPVYRVSLQGDKASANAYSRRDHERLFANLESLNFARGHLWKIGKEGYIPRISVVFSPANRF